ncbi:hypothetical protein Vafri_2680 [Volvox africanus]|uniref:Anaphase-promoting complex subunit 4 n=1 Tax=Volvox africanus TaxID=51714 RepID=A0A8J4ET23_9CHLO|nr:hypothetical protein Vafri_2680 [Volvox africanus]
MFACGEVMVASLPPRANDAMDGHGGEGARELGSATAAAAGGYSGARGELPGTLQALLSRDLNFLLVVSEPAAAAEATESGRGSGSRSSSGGGGSSGRGAGTAAAVLSVYGCGKLGSCQEEILELSLLGGLVAGRLEAAAAALVAAARAWKGAAAELSKRMDEQLREALANHGHDPDDALGELTCMLASGHVSAPLHSFLTGSLTEAGLRRLAKTVDLAVQEVSSLLLDGVLPALQLVVFVMGELRGRARTASIVQTLGLQERAVAVAEVEAVKALIQLESLRQLVTRVGCQYRVFFTWLLKTLQSLEEARPPSSEGPLPGGPLPGTGSLADAPICFPTLLAFLEEGGQLSADAVARDLDASQSTLGLPVGSLTFPPDLLPHLKALQEVAFPMPPPEEPGAVEVGDISPPDGGSTAAGPSRGVSGGSSAGVGEGGSGGSSWPDKPLQRQLGLLAELCRRAFGRLQKDVSPSVQLLTRIPLLPAPAPQRWLPYGGPCCGDGGGECGRRCSLQLPQIRTEPPVGKPALLACVLPAVALPLPLGNRDRDMLLLMQVALQPQQSSPQALPRCRHERVCWNYPTV